MTRRRRIWFVSDWHFGHANIIKYCDRPFANTAEMDQCIIDNHNSVVDPMDKYYCLGDVAIRKPDLKSVLKLNGHGRLVGGNHDIYKTKDYLNAGFEEVMAMRVMANILFTHIPVAPASFGRFRANVHGHIHNNQSGAYPFPYINLSVEVINYTPVELDEIVARVDKERQNGEQCFGNGSPVGDYPGSSVGQ